MNYNKEQTVEIIESYYNGDDDKIIWTVELQNGDRYPLIWSREEFKNALSIKSEAEIPPEILESSLKNFVGKKINLLIKPPINQKSKK